MGFREYILEDAKDDRARDVMASFIKKMLSGEGIVSTIEKGNSFLNSVVIKVPKVSGWRRKKQYGLPLDDEETFKKVLRKLGFGFSKHRNRNFFEMINFDKQIRVEKDYDDEPEHVCYDVFVKENGFD